MAKTVRVDTGPSQPAIQPVDMDAMRADWAAEAKVVGATPAGDMGLTVREIAEAMGVSRTTAGRRVRMGVASGRYVRGIGYRPRSDRQCGQVPVFWLTKQEGAQKP